MTTYPKFNIGDLVYYHNSVTMAPVVSSFATKIVGIVIATTDNFFTVYWLPENSINIHVSYKSHLIKIK